MQQMKPEEIFLTCNQICFIKDLKLRITNKINEGFFLVLTSITLKVILLVFPPIIRIYVGNSVILYMV